MILLGLDPTYNTIVSAAQFSGDIVNSVNMQVSGISRITNLAAISTTFEDDEFEAMLASKNVSMQTFFDASNKYIVANGVLTLRPTLTISVTTNVISKDGSLVVPLNTDITVRITYNDPDGIDYLQNGLPISVVDKFDFVTVPALTVSTLTDTQTYSEFVVNSAFPGICKLKAKDANKLCSGISTQIRFRQ